MFNKLKIVNFDSPVIFVSFILHVKVTRFLDLD